MSVETIAPETAYATQNEPMYRPRCGCGWFGPATYFRDTAATNERLHIERCTGGQGVLL